MLYVNWERELFQKDNGYIVPQIVLLGFLLEICRPGLNLVSWLLRKQALVSSNISVK